MKHEWWGYWDCIYPSLVYVSLKEFGVMGLDMYTWGIKDFHKCWSGSLAKRRLCLGPTSVINGTPLSAPSFWVSLFPGTCVYNKRSLMGYSLWRCKESDTTEWLNNSNITLNTSLWCRGQDILPSLGFPNSWGAESFVNQHLACVCTLSMMHGWDKEFCFCVFSVVQICVEALVKQKEQSHWKFMRLFNSVYFLQQKLGWNTGYHFSTSRRKRNEKEQKRRMQFS